MNPELLSGPPRVQIQTQSGCDGRCVFCPNEEVLKSGLTQGRMPPELFHKVIDELAETRPRRISPYLMNEPLLDKRLPEFVSYTSEKVPGATTLVTTNGTHLSEEAVEALIDAGLKRLKVSLQSLDPETNRKLMGYGSERVIENILAAKGVIKKKRAKHLDFRVSMLVTNVNEDEIAAARKFWAKHGVRLVTSALENRGGNIADADHLNPGEMKVRSGCIRPSREMCILFNGDVALCCVDWHRTTIIGNVAQLSVREVWNNSRITQIRDAFRNRSTAKLPDICVECTESACPNRHRRSLKGFLSRLVPAS